MRIIEWLEKDEEDGYSPNFGVRLSLVRPTEEGLSLVFDLLEGSEVRERVELLCVDEISYCMRSLGHVGGMRLLDDHVLLWPRTRRNCDLFFRGAPADATNLQGELFVAHARLTAGWLDPAFRGTEILEVGYGKLAAGPEPLIQAYAAVLERHGVEASIITSHLEPKPARALIFGCNADDSWVVARDFVERPL